MKKNFFGSIFVAVLVVIMFYLLGIVVNSIIIKELFDVDPVKTPIWSGPGFMFAVIAAVVGLFCPKVYKKLKNEW